MLEQELTKRLEEAGGSSQEPLVNILPDAQVEVLEQELTKRLEEAGGSSQELETLRKRLTDVDQERRLLEDRLDNAKVRKKFSKPLALVACHCGLTPRILSRLSVAYFTMSGARSRSASLLF